MMRKRREVTGRREGRKAVAKLMSIARQGSPEMDVEGQRAKRPFSAILKMAAVKATISHFKAHVFLPEGKMRSHLDSLRVSAIASHIRLNLKGVGGGLRLHEARCAKYVRLRLSLLIPTYFNTTSRW